MEKGLRMMPHLKQVPELRPPQYRLLMFPKNQRQEQIATRLVWKRAAMIRLARIPFLRDREFRTKLEMYARPSSLKVLAITLRCMDAK